MAVGRRFLLRIGGAAGLVLGLSGCFEPTGPVFGDWYGYQTGAADGYDRSVSLVLNGTPNARSGAYHYRAVRRMSGVGWATTVSGNSDRWDGQWQAHNVTVDGQTLTRIDLDKLPPNERHSYILMAGHVLVPVSVGGSGPDLTKPGLESRLVPRPLTAYGYGRV